MDNKSYTTATTTTASFTPSQTHEEDKDDGASFHPPKTHDDEYGGSVGGGRLPQKNLDLCRTYDQASVELLPLPHSVHPLPTHHLDHCIVLVVVVVVV